MKPEEMKPEEKALIELFFNYFKTRNKALFSMLKSGLSNEKIGNQLNKLDFEVPPVIPFFYSQKDGYKLDCMLKTSQMLVLENGLMMSLEKSVNEYNSWMIREPDLKRKLPLFDNGGGDFLLIDCDKSSETYKKILIYAPYLGIVEPVTIYGSLNQLLATTMRCFMVGAYYYNDKAELEIDAEKQYIEAIRLNPSCVYWSRY